MSRGILILVIVMIILIIASGVLYLVMRPTYGNDIPGVTKAIKENGGSEEPPTIINMLDISGNRYAGFVEGEDTLGVAIFFSDGRGGYVYENIHRQQGKSIVAFYEPFAVSMEGTHGVDIVISKNPLLYKVERYIDGVLESTVTPNTAGISLITMEFHSIETAINVELKYYDAKGNILTP